ncbi:MAG: hypothetical protein Q8M02_03275 [Candidatus Didemnitutus sp.]|nr:hypothetical protein [Candidatus Didemnitutus sp.]
MTTRSDTLPLSAAAAAPAAPAANKATTALGIGAAGMALTLLGLLVDKPATIAVSWLIGMTFWTGIALGVLLLVMIHHIFDAGWSTVLRRQYEHVLAVFPWLLLLFVPLLVVAWTQPALLWKWMDPAFDLAAVGGHGTVGDDPLWVKKAAFLNREFFTGFTIFSFLAWWFLASRFRRNSFSQDSDGALKWTFSSRMWSAAGIPLTAITLSLCIILWVKSMEYHWFSTMYGVWFFAGCIRAALSLGVVLLVWLWSRGDLKGILNNNHLHSIGQLMLAFTVFWAYVTFSQYFLIWNANIPEETFWYNVREMNNSDGQFNQWGWVGMFLLFGHFFFPFFLLLSYRFKVSKNIIPWVGVFIAFVFLIDLCYNIMPSKKFANGDPYPFLQSGLLWTVTAVIGIGGVFIWSYLRSFPHTKLIPIRDPRIGESLTHHEASAL